MLYLTKTLSFVSFSLVIAILCLYILTICLGFLLCNENHCKIFPLSYIRSSMNSLILLSMRMQRDSASHSLNHLRRKNQCQMFFNESDVLNECGWQPIQFKNTKIIFKTLQCAVQMVAASNFLSQLRRQELHCRIILFLKLYPQ